MTIRRERDYFAALLELEERDPREIAPVALRHLVDLTEARFGRLELFDEGRPVFATTHPASAGPGRPSRGIVTEALSRGELVRTASASTDPRFRDRDSVRRGRVGAVLCAPVGTDPSVGVVYLEGPPFERAAESEVRRFAHRLGPLAERLRRGRTPSREGLAVPGVVSRSRAMRRVLERLRVVAELDVDVLFVGSSGTGKSMLARAVHEGSARRDGPFVELNCAALPEPLFENELFGAAPGAHSAVPAGGAEGKLAAAEAGTLFLDEVGELPLGAQAKLLHLLQSRRYFRLGETRERRADVRVLAATNTSLPDAIAAGRFREDLYYRLNVLQVRVPELAERRDDIEPLAQRLIAEIRARHGFGALRITAGALRALREAEWPGNVRQLSNVLERAAVAARVEGVPEVTATHVFPSAGAVDEPSEALHDQLHAARARILREALDAHEWNVAKTARRLEIARSYLYKLMKIHGIQR